ncbi:MAG TPA: hypothetical protein HPP77_06165, partial [Candidatus Hydrogenedentes bacterium]|nr:hypothetical protein [Candidatus Hydrogenedentota bacterium]
SQDAKTYELYSVGFSREEYVFYSRHFHVPVLTELLPVGDEAPRVRYRQQKQMRKAIAEAARVVPVASFENLTEAELAALGTALAGALEDADVDPRFAREFSTALIEALAEFHEKFANDVPAFFFVQEEDWRWMLGLYEPFQSLAVIHHMSVGNRSVLLVANTTGAELVQSE